MTENDKPGREPVFEIRLGDSVPQCIGYQQALQSVSRLFDQANFAAAAAVSTQMAAQAPDNAGIQHLAGEALYMLQQIDQARAYVDRALVLQPGSISSLVLKSRICLYQGDSDQAAEAIDQALAACPDDSRLHAEKAELLLEAGKIDDARNSFIRAIELNPRNAAALFGLSKLPGDSFDDALIRSTAFLVQSGQFSGEDLIQAQFALAYACEKKGDLDRQFQYLHAANRLKNAQLNFDPILARREVQRAIDYFSPDFFDRRAQDHRCGNPARLIFIVGFPRCGSTLVEQILSSHPAVAGAGEIMALRHALRDHAARRQITGPYPDWIDSRSQEDLAGIASDYLARAESVNTREVLTDKLLDNYMLVGLIWLLFPNAKIVHVQRNPVDTCYSCYRRLFNLASIPYSYDLSHLVSKYRDYRQIMAHWEQVLPGHVHTVRYEQLVRDQEQVTRALLEYCDLPWNDRCMEFHRNTRTVLTSSNAQVRQSLYADAIDRWKAYEPYLAPLMELLES